jgi:hypothetical protein
MSMKHRRSYLSLTGANDTENLVNHKLLLLPTLTFACTFFHHRI